MVASSKLAPEKLREAILWLDLVLRLLCSGTLTPRTVAQRMRECMPADLFYENLQPKPLQRRPAHARRKAWHRRAARTRRDR